MKFWKRLLTKFVSLEEFSKLVITTLVVFLAILTLTHDFDLWNLLKSLVIAVFFFLITNANQIHFEDYLKSRHDVKLKIDPKTDFEIANEPELLFNYYIESLNSMTDNARKLRRDGMVSATPQSLYNHIIFCAKHFNDKFISIDYDLDAWFYACEKEDFESVAEGCNDGKEKNILEELKVDYIQNVALRRRIDLAYKVFSALMERNDKGILPRVERIIVLQNQQLGIKEQVILSALLRMNRTTNQENRIIYDNSNTRKKLLLLQDVVVFDNSIAFKEYIRDKAKGEGESDSFSEIITSDKKIKEVVDIFSELYARAKPIVRKN